MSETEKRKSPWQWLGVLVVAGLMVLLLRHVDWQAVKAGFAAVDLRFLPVLVLLIALNFLIRSWRWRHLLSGGSSMKLRSLIDATVIGFTGTFLLPFRAGEVVRPWILTRWEKIGFGASAASIVVERVVDALTIIGFLAVAITWIDNPPEWLGTGAKLLGGVAVIGVGFMVMAYFFSRAFSKLARKMISIFLFPKFLARVRAGLYQLVDGFLEGLKAISTGRQLTVVLIASVVLWLEMALFYQATLWTMGINLGPAAGLMVTVLVALAVAAPGPPGFLGTFQIGCLAALGLFEISREVGLSYAIVAHFLQAACIIPAGLWILQARGLKLRESLPVSKTAPEELASDDAQPSEHKPGS